MVEEEDVVVKRLKELKTERRQEDMWKEPREREGDEDGREINATE